MSLRALWVISLSSGEKRNMAFSRRYNSIELRAQKLYGNEYCKIPDNQTLIQCIFAEFGFIPESKKFQKWRDTCDRNVQAPAINLKIPGGSLWPILIIEQNGFLYCCLPFIDDKSAVIAKRLFNGPSVAVGFSLLTNIADFCEPAVPGQSHEPMSQRLTELGNVLIIGMPFGTLMETDMFSLQTLLSCKQFAIPKTNQKQPLWRSTPFKGKSNVQVAVTEYVRCIQHESMSSSQVETSLYGSLSCLAQFTGSIVQNLNMVIRHYDPGSKLVLDDVVVHSSVEPSESGLGILTDNGAACRLKFSPPSHRLKLLNFTSPTDDGPPICGSYKMQGTTKVDLLLQLKLNDQLKNSFEYFDVFMPFFHRGIISHVDCKPTSGAVRVSDDRRNLVWNLGQKFPGRAASVSLTATCYFNESEASKNVIEDPFCVGMNAYCSVKFKMSDYTLSGCHIDQRYVQTTPNTKFKFSFHAEVLSAEYKIWNYYGDSPLTA